MRTLSPSHRVCWSYQPEPTILDCFAFGNGDEGSGPGFGSKQIVTGFIELLFCHVVADGEQATTFVHQHFEIHFMDQAIGRIGNLRKICRQCLYVPMQPGSSFNEATGEFLRRARVAAFETVGAVSVPDPHRMPQTWQESDL